MKERDKLKALLIVTIILAFLSKGFEAKRVMDGYSGKLEEIIRDNAVSGAP